MSPKKLDFAPYAVLALFSLLVILWGVHDHRWQEPGLFLAIFGAIAWAYHRYGGRFL